MVKIYMKWGSKRNNRMGSLGYTPLPMLYSINNQARRETNLLATLETHLLSILFSIIISVYNIKARPI